MGQFVTFLWDTKSLTLFLWSPIPSLQIYSLNGAETGPSILGSSHDEGHALGDDKGMLELGR